MKTDEPIAGATVTHCYMRRPYFIVGTIVKCEDKTDKAGTVRLKDRDGAVYVEAPGYTQAGVSGDYSRELTVFLSPIPEGR